MNGGQDLGGMHGLGPVDPEPETEEPVFHADWEKRVFGLTLASGALGRWSIDQGRHARERQHPADYLRNSYYQNWLAGLETVLVESGVVSEQELRSGRPAGPADPELTARVLRAERVAPAMRASRAYEMPVERPPRFQPGERVRARNRHPVGHTREPRYVRGRTGVIHAHHGAHVFPDRSAEGVKVGEHLYSVRFEAAELWGEAAGPGAVYLDLFEDYLEPAP